ncbi:hypothetical protein LTR16_002101 [Cryomyces antarcticus]|uniref:TLC domain-containing protein n=1 Tax=Cryomyces antarcticus TaxID=329879 RepID=A0ABR0LZ60_9PEZI|nr:hypothetical protein LTR60_004001 [Cryomyces antarcticus]KAK5017723.1 hypothetical protein LTR39_001381 [Cryomyces antarcticus]KAK5256909.1 hypothetical protein LTR16_002101 [Cryomyces antarcticus]
MLDPFPFPAPLVLQQAIRPFADYFCLTTLPLHIHEVLFFAFFYQAINAYLSPPLSRALFPRAYAALNQRSRINWDVHVVSMLQSLLVCGTALWVIWCDEERGEMNWRGRVWGYTGAGGFLQAMAAGYFLWDLVVSTVHFSVFGAGLWAHAVAALMVFSLGFRPFVNFYGPIFILYELSSPFLNIHWFLDKLSLTGSNLQLINGIFLTTTFFFCRLFWGAYSSWRVFGDIYRAMAVQGVLYGTTAPSGAVVGGAPADYGPKSDIMAFAPPEAERLVPVWLAAAYMGANLVLNALNYYWFSRMIQTIRARFEPPLGTKGVGKGGAKGEGKGAGRGERGEQPMMARGVYADGRKTVEVEKREVRTRRRG